MTRRPLVSRKLGKFVDGLGVSVSLLLGGLALAYVVGGLIKWFDTAVMLSSG